MPDQPRSRRSALDAVELMNIGMNFMREHLVEEARIHYVITKGGETPTMFLPLQRCGISSGRPGERRWTRSGLGCSMWRRARP